MFNVNHSLGYLLAMAAKKTSARFMQLMQESGIPFGHSGWIVLSRLWEEDGLSQQEISDRSNVAKPNISKYSEQLENESFIVRTSDPNDKRNYKLYLTQKGKEYKEACHFLAQQANDETMKNLNLDEQQILVSLLKKINT